MLIVIIDFMLETFKPYILDIILYSYYLSWNIDKIYKK